MSVWAELVNDSEGIHVVRHLRCKKWSCPFCKVENGRRLRLILTESVLSYLQRADQSSPKFKYQSKLVTFTLPGEAFRSEHTPAEAEKIGKKNLNKVFKMVRKHRGAVDYAWVQEDQPSSFPHWHALFLGPGVADKDFLPFLVALWTEKYGMGNVDIEVVDNPKGAVFYITKYVTKGKSEAKNKGSHIWAMSKGLAGLVRAVVDSHTKEWTVLRLGFRNTDGTLGHVFWEINSETPPSQAIKLAALSKALSYFEVRKDPFLREQLKFKEMEV